MNFYPTPPRFSPVPSRTTQTEPSLELVVFTVGNLKLALQIELIYKVAYYKPVHGSGLNPVGIAHVDDFEVTVINLHQRLFKASPAEGAATCLVVIQSMTGELYGIPTADTPTLLEIPLSTIRVLPESYRRADTLGIASHVAVVPQPDSTTVTIFLIDRDRLFPHLPAGRALPPSQENR